jgi:hypothetical protein
MDFRNIKNIFIIFLFIILFIHCLSVSWWSCILFIYSCNFFIHYWYHLYWFCLLNGILSTSKFKLFLAIPLTKILFYKLSLEHSTYIIQHIDLIQVYVLWYPLSQYNYATINKATELYNINKITKYNRRDWIRSQCSTYSLFC